MQIQLTAGAVAAALALGGIGCADPADTTGTSTSAASGTGATGSSSGSGGGGGAGAGPSVEDLLADLRADLEGTMKREADASGWPVPVDGGFLFVSTDLTHAELAGDHDGWAGTPMNQDDGFAWLVLEVAPGSKYKLKGGEDFGADPWARSYDYDDFGEISLVVPVVAHVDRFFGVGGATIAPRMLRVWVPAEPATHVLYLHDGQNLFDPSAFFGGWRLQEAAPPAMLLVGLDNTDARMDEYTHVEDDLEGQPIGGEGDAYADYLKDVVRPFVAARYGEPDRAGVMGSSLGGLISLHIADRHPGEYAFAASLSGTVGWGSIGAQNETIIARYAAHGHQGSVLYVDSGGDGACFDADADGTEDDDPDASDNYCENAQLRETLLAVGYADGVDLHYVWEPGAPHNEAAWAARVGVPLGIFAGLRP
jgi:predicted alpha/beta superfamily hydrolase